MIWFEYKYTTSSEIMNSLKLITEYSITEYLLLVFWVFFIIAVILNLLPSLSIFIKYKKEEKKKRDRKNMIKQIAMQKDINDEIEKELNM